MASLVPFCSDVLTCTYSSQLQGLHIGKLYDGHGAIVEEILDLDEPHHVVAGNDPTESNMFLPGQGSPQDIASSLEGKSEIYKF